MNSKLELIKSKCMNSPKKIRRSSSRNTLQSNWGETDNLNDSVDLD